MLTIVLKWSRKFTEDIPISEKLDLPRAIKYHIIILSDKLIQLLLQPCKILHEILHTEEEAAIGSKFHFLHNFLESDEILDVYLEVLIPTSHLYELY